MDNTYQFIHIETFADRARKGSSRPTAGAIAREAARAEKSYPHIKCPAPPLQLFGVSPLVALEKARKVVERCKDARGRKIRADAQFISFGVASIKVESTEENWKSQKTKAWLEDSVKFLAQKFGENLASVVAHTDERWIHIHFCITPSVNSESKLEVAHLHPGLAAQKKLKSNSKKEKDQAYKEAMRSFQDEYFEAVSVKNGLLRFGPKRRRLTRVERHSQKRLAKLLQSIHKKQLLKIELLNKKIFQLAKVSKRLLKKQARPSSSFSGELR